MVFVTNYRAATYRGQVEARALVRCDVEERGWLAPPHRCSDLCRTAGEANSYPVDGLVREYYGAQIANKLGFIMVVPSHRLVGQTQFIEQPAMGISTCSAMPITTH